MSESLKHCVFHLIPSILYHFIAPHHVSNGRILHCARIRIKHDTRGIDVHIDTAFDASSKKEHLKCTLGKAGKKRTLNTSREMQTRTNNSISLSMDSST